LGDRRRDGGTNSTLRTKEQRKHLTLKEHYDDDDDEEDKLCPKLALFTRLYRVALSTKHKNWPSIITVTMGSNKTAELSALGAGSCLPPRKFLGTPFCFRLSGPQGDGGTEVSGYSIIAHDPTGNRIRNLPSWGSVPHQTAPLACRPLRICFNTSAHVFKYYFCQICFTRNPQVKYI